MGTYLNPGNSGFEEIRQSEYVDKTGLIRLINQTIGTKQKLTCISRPRRFGKSFAAQMLRAYYDCTCDSHFLFDDLDIAQSADYEKHLNQYHVIYLDITGFISRIKRCRGDIADVPDHIVEAIKNEVIALYPNVSPNEPLSACLKNCVKATGRKIVFIIDEWDAMIRDAKFNLTAQEQYLNLLREWFKNGNFTSDVVAAAYMTGILPIKKDGSQSAISDFDEYTILAPDSFAEYTGFTEREVQTLCKSHAMDFAEAKKWYDGYFFDEIGSVYNPFSVMSAMRRKKIKSYWKKTSSAEALQTYVDMNMDGLQEDVVRLIAGEHIKIDTDSFENDFETFKSKDDVLTLLIHLGYLAYDEKSETARIPNEEVRIEFNNMLRKGRHLKLMELIRNSDQLLKDTIQGNAAAVSRAIQTVRDSAYAPTYYNEEQALRSTVRSAYITCVDQYMKIEELPTGHGIADLVYIPLRESSLPALVIELKWNKTAEGAIAQIKERNYPAILESYGGEIILVGVNYDENTKNHTCKIEKLVKTQASSAPTAQIPTTR
ncbi:MAG: AAA family ATPase [Lachnospiraceae bacterium]|nr:AAA family ATPase [Lachnospiraceae bacterium]